MYKIKQFFRRIRNLYRWFPIIWKDQDWDDHYIWEILKFKLTNQANYIAEHDRHTRAQYDAKLMRLCVKLMDRVQSEYYRAEYMDYEKTEFLFKPSDHCNNCKELEIVTIEDNLNEYFKKYPLIYKRIMNDEKTLFNKDTKRSIALNVSHMNHNRAKKLLFNILENNIESWWD
jgi:hypothetical protein